MIRVIHWAAGSVGSAQLCEVIDRPDLELVGLYLYGQSKVDIDAGVLAGRPPTGIPATDDASATLELVDTIRYPRNVRRVRKSVVPQRV
jgi:hypothetical protein